MCSNNASDFDVYSNLAQWGISKLWSHPKTLSSSSARLWRLVVQVFGLPIRSQRGRSFSQHERFMTCLWPTGMCTWHVNVHGQSIADIIRTSTAWKVQIKTNKSKLWHKPWTKKKVKQKCAFRRHQPMFRNFSNTDVGVENSTSTTVRYQRHLCQVRWKVFASEVLRLLSSFSCGCL